MANTQMIPAKVGGKTHILIEVTPLSETPAAPHDQNISIPQIPDLEEIWGVVSQIATTIGDKLKQASAKKASVEFGIEIGAESGQLTALLVKGSGKANLKITLEWS